MKGFPKGFFTAVEKAIAVFNSFKADWVFVGAVPVAIWGRVRATTDADFAVSIDFSAAFELDQRMQDAHFEKIEGPIEIPGKRLILSKYWHGGKTGLGIDVFFSTGYDVGKFLEAARERKVSIKFHRRSYWALSAEDLVIMKLLANRAKDVDDVAGVFEAMFGELEWPYIHKWCVALRIEQPLLQIVGEFMERYGISGSLPWQ